MSVYQLGAQLVADLKQVGVGTVLTGVGTVLTGGQATPVSEGAYINNARMASRKWRLCLLCASTSRCDHLCVLTQQLPANSMDC